MDRIKDYLLKDISYKDLVNLLVEMVKSDEIVSIMKKKDFNNLLAE